jgi:hypothetical protein
MTDSFLRNFVYPSNVQMTESIAHPVSLSKKPFIRVLSRPAKRPMSWSQLTHPYGANTARVLGRDSFVRIVDVRKQNSII